jgi:hypothetical protein
VCLTYSRSEADHSRTALPRMYRLLAVAPRKLGAYICRTHRRPRDGCLCVLVPSLRLRSFERVSGGASPTAFARGPIYAGATGWQTSACVRHRTDLNAAPIYSADRHAVLMGLSSRLSVSYRSLWASPLCVITLMPTAAKHLMARTTNVDVNILSLHPGSGSPKHITDRLAALQLRRRMPSIEAR